MSANIAWQTAFFGRSPAWHKLGTVSTDPTIRTVKAMELAGLNYNVLKTPLAAHVETEMGVMAVETGKFAIVREPVPADPEYRTLGIVGSQYKPLQNLEIGEMIDRWLDFPVETVGALGNGEQVFITLKLDTGFVAGEQVEQYFLINDTKDGSSALRIAFTPVRVVCQNTLIAGLSAATSLNWYRHGERLANELDYRFKLLGTLAKLQNETMGSFNRMAEVILEPWQAAEVLTETYPAPKKPRKLHAFDLVDAEGPLASLADEMTQAQAQFEQCIDFQQRRRTLAEELFNRFNDEQPELAYTAWALYNAVVECEDYRPGGNRENAEYIAARDSIWGGRAKAKAVAYNAAAKFI